MKGIVLISLGNPYYIRMAHQLALSLKANENIPIHLVTNNVHYLEGYQKRYFDSIEEPSLDKYSKNNTIQPIKAKTYIYDFSPFDETIFLDADMIVLNQKKISYLFDELKNVELTIANRGSSDISIADEKTSQWADLRKFREVYKLDGKWFQLSSEFIYFKKTERVKQFFDTAKEIYDNPKSDYNLFADGMADELAFGLSCIINNIYPHVENFTPVYWSHAEKRYVKKIDPYINENYYGYSMGGAHASKNQKEFYDNMMVYYHNKLGLKPSFFPAQNKSKYLTERSKI